MMLNAFVLSRDECESILSGNTCWCIRNTVTSKRGTFAIASDELYMIYGKASLVDAVLLDEKMFENNYEKHLSLYTWEQLSGKYKHLYAWVFTNPCRFAAPVLPNNEVAVSGNWIKDAIDDSALIQEYLTKPALHVEQRKVVSSSENLVNAAVSARSANLTYGEYIAKQMCANIPSVQESARIAKLAGNYSTMRDRLAKEATDAS